MFCWFRKNASECQVESQKWYFSVSRRVNLTNVLTVSVLNRGFVRSCNFSLFHWLHPIIFLKKLNHVSVQFWKSLLIIENALLISLLMDDKCWCSIIIHNGCTRTAHVTRRYAFTGTHCHHTSKVVYLVTSLFLHHKEYFCCSQSSDLISTRSTL